jgi:NAD(P)-dependent dehydrogenase (short-subunit alcohol dehydrogenase family)
MGKVAIVTGAASPAGLGFATARALAREGATVVLSDIDEAGVRGRAAELVSLGLKASAIAHDVTREEDWQAVIRYVLDTYGRLDILVNNAGITHGDSIATMSLENWRRQIDVNLTGSFLGCKHAVTAFRHRQEGGSIVNVSSISGLRGFNQSAAYGSSKGGVRQLSKVVATEGATEGIRCNSVYPGMILTDIHQNIVRKSPERHRAIVERIPMARMGEPDDVAYAIVYLASAEAKYVTGAEIVIDGGLMAAG